MEESILTSIKAFLNVPEEIEDFDPQIIMHINSAFSYMHGLGVGPEGFRIKDASTTWDAYTSVDYLPEIISLVYLRVRMLFDPPTTTILEKAFTEQMRELEWRVNEKREEKEWQPPTLPGQQMRLF